MLAKVAGGFGITRVQVMTDHMPVSFSFAVLSVALKDMNTAVLDVLDQRSRLEERIDRRVPVF